MASPQAHILTRDLQAPADSVSLEGSLALPDGASAVIVFAHGSGSSRFSRRNRAVAEALNQSGFATFLFDLLTSEENEIDERTRELRFDIDLLARRLDGVVRWLSEEPDTRSMRVGLFGASTGAAAALVAAASSPSLVGAVVSRGGRPDLAGPALADVEAPTLLIVGGADTPVIELNEKAAAQLRAPHELVIVPGATHLFPEPGALERVFELARDWFASRLGPPPGVRES